MVFPRGNVRKHFCWAIASLSLFGGCRSVPQHDCVPASGTEVWIEVHRPVDPVARERSNLEVRLIADTASSSPPAEQNMLLRIRSADSAARSKLQGMVFTAARPASLQLPPGSHVILLRGITYEAVSRRVVIAPDEQVTVEVQPRHARYCLSDVVVTQD